LGTSVNPKIANSGYVNPPYNLSKPIVDFTANGKDKYVRVFTKGETKHAGQLVYLDYMVD
jgi:hypothetical protein